MTIPDHLIAIGILAGVAFWLLSIWLTARHCTQRGINTGRAEADRKNRPRADIESLKEAETRQKREEAFRKLHQAPSKAGWPTNDPDLRGSHRHEIEQHGRDYFLRQPAETTKAP